MKPFCVDAGEGPPLVLLHGWTMDSRIFEDQINRLSPSFRCLVPDLPGHGRSALIEPTLDSAAMALQQVLDRVPDQKATLVGWSMGAMVAWRYIELFGQSRLAALATVDMSPKLANGPRWRYGLKRSTRRAGLQPQPLAWSDRAEAIARGMFCTGGDATPRLKEAAKKMVMSQDQRAMRVMWASMMKADERSVIGKITLPWLICYGTHSRVYPSALRTWLLGRAPQARALGFDQSGHSPHLEEPLVFAQAITRFAEESALQSPD